MFTIAVYIKKYGIPIASGPFCRLNRADILLHEQARAVWAPVVPSTNLAQRPSSWAATTNPQWSLIRQTKLSRIRHRGTLESAVREREHKSFACWRTKYEAMNRRILAKESLPDIGDLDRVECLRKCVECVDCSDGYGAKRIGTLIVLEDVEECCVGSGDASKKQGYKGAGGAW